MIAASRISYLEHEGCCACATPEGLNSARRSRHPHRSPRRNGADILHAVGLFLALRRRRRTRHGHIRTEKPRRSGSQRFALADSGTYCGPIEGTAEAWLNRQSLADQLTRVRDGAAQKCWKLDQRADKAASRQPLTCDFSEDVRRRRCRSPDSGAGSSSEEQSEKRRWQPAGASTRRQPPRSCPRSRQTASEARSHDAGRQDR